MECNAQIKALWESLAEQGFYLESIEFKTMPSGQADNHKLLVDYSVTVSVRKDKK